MSRHTSLLAHRGWSARFPENTALAFEQALRLGIDGIEFDVQLTRDEVPVVIHDPTVDRTTDGHGRVRDLSYRELQHLNAARAWAAKGLAAQPVPSLDAVLDRIERFKPHGVHNIELKVHEGDGRALVDHVWSRVQNRAFHQQVLYASFHHACLAYLKSIHPSARVGLLYEQPAPEPWYVARHMGAESVHLHQTLATADVLAACRASGVRVCVWTVDDPLQMTALYRKGVDLMITNVPDEALRVRRQEQGW
ncbi:MAG: hypothetical protein K6T78_11460 [Alicyclobacillus sp.]|nr:hypothetical protein [Alicyclobacillus sp.]